MTKAVILTILDIFRPGLAVSDVNGDVCCQTGP